MNRIQRLFWAAPCSILFVASASAQGGDDCSTPTAIAGPGSFSVNTLSATNSTQQSGSCPMANRDVWFAWTATQTRTVTMTTCGGVASDTVIAAYNASGCPVAGQLLACNDDDFGCNLQSSITFATTAGNTYML